MLCEGEVGSFWKIHDNPGGHCYWIESAPSYTPLMFDTKTYPTPIPLENQSDRKLSLFEAGNSYV